MTNKNKYICNIYKYKLRHLFNKTKNNKNTININNINNITTTIATTTLQQ